jgi:hypothetical protein
MGNGIVLLSVSSGWMDILEVLASSMTGSRGDLAKAYFSSTETISLSAISQLSISQTKARLMSPLMEMIQRGPGIFKTN